MVRQKRIRKQFLIGYFTILHFLSAVAQPGDQDSNYSSGGRLYAAKIEYVSSFDSEKDVTAYSFRMGYGTFIFRNFALFGLLDISGTKGYCLGRTDIGEQRSNAESFGLGASFLARWHIVQRGKISLFLDVGAGILYTFQSFPPNGTKLNFTTRPAVGLSIQLTKNMRLLTGANRFHLSNGQGYNHSHNPALDGLGVFAGVVFRRK